MWVDQPDGSALVRPVPDIMSLFGSAGTAQARDPDEKAKARAAWAAQSESRKK